jgi:hypothetical protein
MPRDKIFRNCLPFRSTWAHPHFLVGSCYCMPIWCLWPNIRFLPLSVTEKNATKNILDGRTDRGKTVYPPPPSGSGGIFGHKLHIGTPYRGKRFCTHQIPTSCLPTLLIFLHIEHKQSRQTGSRNLTGPKSLPTIWHTYMKLVTKYQIPVINSCWEKCIVGSVFGPIRFLLPVYRFCWFLYTFNIHLYMHIFRRIFLSNFPTIWGTYMMLVTKYQISAINSCWEKSDKKCAYMFNVYRNQLSRQTGSRNLTL